MKYTIEIKKELPMEKENDYTKSETIFAQTIEIEDTSTIANIIRAVNSFN